MAQDDNKPSPSGRSDEAESKADDRLNEEHGSPNQGFLCDIRNVSSTLGLKLTMSQSLLDLIQRTLEDRANAAANVTDDGNSATEKKRKAMPTDENSTTDKLKASNFPAGRLTIGDWSYTSTYGGDLVAKIYFAKRKLVWEVLDSDGLKNKMEILWSNVSAIKATCPEDGLGTLDVVLARRPLFFREIDPQPRKHTLWQSNADFTGGQASTYRRHFLECPSALLRKNFKKLIQFDEQLNMLSQQPATILDSPDELQSLIFEDQVEPQMCNTPYILNKYYANTSIFADPPFGSTLMFPTASGLGKASEFVSQAITLPRSGPLLFPPTNTQTVDGNAFSEMQYLSNPNFSGQYNVHRLQGSVQPDSFVNQTNRGISEQMASCDPSSNNEMLGYLIQCLLDDTQDVQTASDEKSVMSTIDFLHRLIQEHPASTAETANSNGASTVNNSYGTSETANSSSEAGDDGPPTAATVNNSYGTNETPNSSSEAGDDGPPTAVTVNNSYGTNETANSSSEAGDDGPPTAVSREEESHGELLTQIPRVASMPQIFRMASDDSENRKT